VSKRKTITYFDSTGAGNTEELIAIVAERLKEGDIDTVVVATTSGASAIKVAKGVPEGTKVFAVNHQPPRVDAALKGEAESLGVVFIRTDPKIKYLKDVAGESPDSFRRLGQGMKVAVEVVMQAVEVGFIPKGARVIGIGGTSRGSDVAIVARAAGPEDMSEMWVSEILAKPV
jgi:hypothetical protein